MPGIDSRKSELALIPLSTGSNYYVVHPNGEIEVEGYLEEDLFVISDLMVSKNFASHPPKLTIENDGIRNWYPDIRNEYENLLNQPMSAKEKEKLIDELFRSKQDGDDVNFTDILLGDENDNEKTLSRLDEMKTVSKRRQESPRFFQKMVKTPNLLWNKPPEDKQQLNLFVGEKLGDKEHEILASSRNSYGRLTMTGTYQRTDPYGEVETQNRKVTQNRRATGRDPLIYKPSANRTLNFEIPQREPKSHGQNLIKIPVKETKPPEYTKINTRNLSVLNSRIGDELSNQTIYAVETDREKFETPIPDPHEDWLLYLLRVKEELLYFTLYIGADESQMFDESAIVRQCVYYIIRKGLAPRRIGKDGSALQRLGSTMARIDDLIQQIFLLFVDKNQLLRHIENRPFDQNDMTIDMFVDQLRIRLEYIFGSLDKELFFKYLVNSFKNDNQLKNFFETRFLYDPEDKINFKTLTRSLHNFIASRFKPKISKINSMEIKEESEKTNIEKMQEEIIEEMTFSLLAD